LPATAAASKLAPKARMAAITGALTTVPPGKLVIMEPAWQPAPAIAPRTKSSATATLLKPVP
jgi:hypothetical protein